MVKEKKISVIVSAYNTEKYIVKCIDSILNQTHKNIEVIIVNDCSTDNTIKKISKYKNNDKVILINNKENKGLSYSRNIGLEHATGDYIGYIDSDDYISEEYYSSLLKTILDNNADIAVCDMNMVYEKDDSCTRVKCGNEKNDKIDFISNGLAASACNKLFKKNIINKYKFSEGKVNEDLAVILPLMIESKTVYNDQVFYNYVQRENSIQNSKITDKRFDIFYGVDLTLDRIEKCKNYKEYADSIIFQQLIVLLLYVFPKEKNIFKRSNWFRKFNRYIKKYNIKENKCLKEFINSNGRKHQIYYSALINLSCNGFSFLASLLVSVYNILRKILIHDVIPKKIEESDLIELAKKQNKMKNEKISISVVVPNYNYEKFLYQRLYSILYQKVKINEIIILDDNSSDNSKILIDKICNDLGKYINIKKCFNDKNSGSAFKQWEKGFNLAISDYVWIAEADDYCSNDFLKELIKPIKNNRNIVISYSDTSFIDTVGNVIIKTIKPEIDIMKTGHWDSDFINDGKKEFKNYTFLNCTIANVSSAIIKKGDYSNYFKLSRNYKQAGDWLFYANIMHEGDIAYKNKQLNYYRVHGSNVSSVTKKDAHLKEIMSIHSYFENKYGLNSKQKNEIKKRYKFLKNVWNLEGENEDEKRNR